MNDKPRKDFAITAILASIWFGAVALVLETRDDIPVYLLAIATVFFLMLVPTMKEMVKGADRFSDKARNADDSRHDD